LAHRTPRMVSSPDGRLFALATSGATGNHPTVRIYEWLTLSERLTFRLERESLIHSLAFRPDSKALASCGDDGTILLWSLDGTHGPAPWRLKPSSAESLWRRLADSDATKAWPAMRELIARPRDAPRLLRARVKADVAPSKKRLARLLADLDGDTARARDDAEKALAAVARLVGPDLRQALGKADSPEARRRLRRVLAALDSFTPDEVRHARAVEVLERIATKEATALLRQWEKGPARAVLTQHARAALRRPR